LNKELSHRSHELKALGWNQEDLLSETLKKIDIVICTALIPGKKAPVIIKENMINGMKNGAIIYDLAKPLKNFLNQFQRVEGFKIDLNEKFFLLENFKTLEKLTEVLGLKKEVLVKESKIREEEISTLINERLTAKKEKDYTKADEIRNLLKEKGIELIDQSKEITTWIRS